jgi:hypothetical protein
MTRDPVLVKYPEAKPIPDCAPGYAYEFNGFTIVKNISGTLGWSVKMKETGQLIDCNNIDQGVYKARNLL